MKRQIVVLGDLAYIPLSNGQFATIDAVDVPLVEGYNWTAFSAPKTFYARRQAKVDGVEKTLWLHRVIAGTPDGLFTDHMNGDGLDNRRCNLRLASKVENGMNAKRGDRNSSGFKGVSWHKPARKWQARISVNRKQLHLGLYLSAEDAHAAYARASAELHGEFGRTT